MDLNQSSLTNIAILDLNKYILNDSVGNKGP